MGWRFSFQGALPPLSHHGQALQGFGQPPQRLNTATASGTVQHPRGKRARALGQLLVFAFSFPGGGRKRSPLCGGTHKHGEGGCWHRLPWPSLGSRVFQHRRTELKQGFLGHRSQMLSSRASYALTPFTSSSPSKAVGFPTQSTAPGRGGDPDCVCSNVQERSLGHLDAKLLLDVLQARLCGANGTITASPALARSSRLAAKLAPLELTQVLMSMSLNCLSL